MLDWVFLSDDLTEYMPRVLPESWRILRVGNAFLGKAFQRRDGLRVLCSVEIQKQRGACRWLHVSASRQHRIPSYQDMIEVKALFVGPEMKAIQVFPKQSEHVNTNPHVLHLWCNLDRDDLPDFRRQYSDGQLSI